MRVLHVTAGTGSGGADAVARRLVAGLRRQGQEAWLAAGRRGRHDTDVLAIPHDADAGWRGTGYRAAYDGLRAVAARWPGSGAGSAARLLRLATHPEARAAWRDGREDFDYPGTARLLALPPAAPDIVHLHNLHGGYFDLRALGPLSARVPVCATLHDAWLLTGHCAHSFDCERWRTGCGHCPDLTIEPALRRDGTAENWERKRAIYATSRLHVSAPSQWLLDRVRQSMLAPAVASARVIPNGVDTAAFSPGDATRARATFGIPAHATVLMVTTGEPGAPWRDTALLGAALERLQAASPNRAFTLLATGRAALTGLSPALTARTVVTGHLAADRMVDAFRAADVYIHAARVDTFPTAVIEALACGVPVVATRTGGIPEQVLGLPADALQATHSGSIPDATGVLVEPGDADAMAVATGALLANPLLRRAMGARATADARARFTIEAQVRACETWYCEILSARHAA